MEQHLAAIATGTAGNTISSAIIVPLIEGLLQQIDDVLKFEKNRELLGEQLNRVKGLVLDIGALFRDQQRELPDSLNNSLQSMKREVGKGQELIRRSEGPSQQHFIDYLHFQPVPTQIRKWNESINGLLNNLSNDFFLISSALHIASAPRQQEDVLISSARQITSDARQQEGVLICSAQQIVDDAPQQEDVLLQDLPDTGLIGMKIQDAEIQLQRWVSEAPHVHIIGVYGMGGVGKTTLLKKVYNAYISKEVSHSFEHVIWVTVSQFQIEQMQNDIASTINLNLAKCTSADTRKMKLSAYMKTKKFLLVLDDMWREVNLKELGVEVDTQKGSIVVFSTRNKDLIREMNAEESMQLQPLSTEEAWELFSKVAFKDDDVPEDMEDIARQVADECKGLPLAINVVASTLRGNSAVNEWKHALRQMQKVDLNFPLTHPRIDRDLYQRLRWSYDCLPEPLKDCFLYCALCPEDALNWNHFFVHGWIGEGLVTTDADYDYVSETAHSYVKLLENRCLFNVLHYGRTPRVITVHDVVRDMAIHIGEREEKCVLKAGQRLQHFPDIESIHADCSRISVWGNDITSLPAKELRCSKLVTLILRENYNLQNVPDAFLGNLTSLKVLDLSRTAINSLPTSLWQLTQLQLLDLSYTQIENVPEDICYLYRLRFLRLECCSELKCLSLKVGELKNLYYLNLSGCDNLKEIPHEVKMLQNCEIIMP